MSTFERKNVKASKLTPTQVLEIKEHYGNGVTQGALCRAYGVSVGQIGRIVRGESWGSVGGIAASPEQAAASEAAFFARHKAKETAGPEIAKLAEEFKEMLNEQPPAFRKPPPSALDDDEPADAEEPGEGLSALQRTAAKYGLDIEKLRSGK